MMLYKNGRLCSGPFSFALPEGFYLDTSVPDAYYNTVTFSAPDHSFQLRLTIEETDLDARRALEEEVDELDPEDILRQITPIPHPVPGCDVIYTGYVPGEQCYQAHFDGDANGKPYKCGVCLDSSVPMDRVLTHPGVQAVLASVRLEPQEA